MGVQTVVLTAGSKECLRVVRWEQHWVVCSARHWVGPRAGWWAGNSADCWESKKADLLVAHSVDLLVAPRAVYLGGSWADSTEHCWAVSWACWMAVNSAEMTAGHLGDSLVALMALLTAARSVGQTVARWVELTEYS